MAETPLTLAAITLRRRIDINGKTADAGTVLEGDALLQFPPANLRGLINSGMATPHYALPKRGAKP
jgi:hypothetical protein